jgi:hypothetical protein
MEGLAQSASPPDYCGTMAVTGREPTMTERIMERKQRLETELATVNEALKLLEVHPSVARVFDAISKIRF